MVLVLAMLVSLSNGAATSPLQARDSHHVVWASAGFVSTWALQLGAGWQVAEGWRMGATAETLLVRPFANGGRMSVGVSRRWLFGEWLGLGVEAQLGVPWANDFVGSWLGLDVRVAVQPGVYRSRWVLAFDLAAIPTLGVSLMPNLVVRDLFGDRPGSAVQAPRETVLALPSLRFDLGLNGRVLVAGGAAGLRLWVQASASFVVTPTRLSVAGQPTSTLPFTTLLGALCEL